MGSDATTPTLDASAANDTVDETVPAPTARPYVDASDPDLATANPDRYGVGREIARGGMGRIIAARDRRLGREVAIKELLAPTPELRGRFEREARITARLQHPAIVSLLEAGRWPSGDPFYVMKLVAGASLDKVIAARPTLDARLGLLPHVIAAVDALAYAHSQRVIHRDLKPSNVLVGDYGETVVIDWGLAKDLTDTSATPDVSVGPTRRSRSVIDPNATEIGAVMGTPAYMPPEQAKGEGVDERADVYALGAMLYHVLAGAPPYTGKTVEAVLDLVLAGPPLAVNAHTPDVPADLVTIVAKAMSRNPEERYATARQLADDLKKFQTGQLVGAHHYTAWQLLTRWLRRHRTPVAVAVIALAVLGVLAVVGVQRIVREQARAEHSRRDAEDLMSFMLGSLHTKLGQVGRLDLLDDVATKAIAYYDQRGDNLSTEDLASLSLARMNLGDVLAARGRVDDALRQYQSAVALAAKVAARDPASAEHQHELSRAYDKLGDGRSAQGDADAALAQYRAGMAIAERIAASAPTTAAWQRDLLVSHTKIGDALAMRGDRGGAVAEKRRALEIAKLLAAREPTNVVAKRDLAVSHSELGQLLADEDIRAALAEHRASVEIRQRLATEDPKNAIAQRDLAWGRLRLSEVLEATGDLGGALVELRAAGAVAAQLAVDDPQNSTARTQLAAVHERVGAILLEQGDRAGALREQRDGLAIREALAAAAPSNSDVQRDVGVSHEKVGNVLAAMGDQAGAVAAYRASVSISERLATNQPTNAEYQRDLGVSLLELGDALTAAKDIAGAITQIRAALVIAEKLSTTNATNTTYLRDLSVAHSKLGEALLAHGDAAAALTEFRADLEIALRIATKDPSNPGWQRDVAESHQTVGDALLAQGQGAAAAAEYEAALAIAKTLAANDPDDADVQELAATVTAKLAKASKPQRGK